MTGVIRNITPMSYETHLLSDLTTQVVGLQAQVMRLSAQIAEYTRPVDAPAFIPGDKAAATFCGLSVPTFIKLMASQDIIPVRTDRGKLWRRADLLKMRGDATPFLPNNPHPFSERHNADPDNQHNETPCKQAQKHTATRPTSKPTTTPLPHACDTSAPTQRRQSTSANGKSSSTKRPKPCSRAQAGSPRKPNTHAFAK